MKKILFILLLFVNLQCVINQDGDIELRSYTTAEAQNMTTEASFFCWYCQENINYLTPEEQKKHTDNCWQECKDCGLKFRYKSDLNLHKKDCMSGDNRTTCSYCGAECSTVEGKKTHEASCLYKNTGGGINTGTSVPSGYHSVFQYLPSDRWEGGDLSFTLSSLAYVEFAQPKYKHNASEIGAFKSKCENFRFIINVDLCRAPGYSPKIYINGKLFYVNYVDYTSHWSSPSCIVFFQASGSSVYETCCTIGCNDNGDYLTLMCNQAFAGRGCPVGYCFEISPAILMSLVESNGKWTL